MTIWPYKVNDIVFNPEQGRFIITRIEPYRRIGNIDAEGKIHGKKILNTGKISKKETEISRYGLVIVAEGTE